MKPRSAGMALISILFSLLIAAVIIFAALMIYKGGKKGEEQVITSPIERGKGVQCLAQIRRLDTAIQMYVAEHREYPLELNQLEKLSDEQFYCPVTKNRYDYNAHIGEVSCPDHRK